jgi:hypothetical protein
MDKLEESEKKNRKETKKLRNPTLLSSLLDFYCHIFTFGVKFLFQLLRLGEI